jgi:hypothetical protein
MIDCYLTNSDPKILQDFIELPVVTVESPASLSVPAQETSQGLPAVEENVSVQPSLGTGRMFNPCA